MGPPPPLLSAGNDALSFEFLGRVHRKNWSKKMLEKQGLDPVFKARGLIPSTYFKNQ